MPGREHRGKSIDSVACAIITVSDTRTPENDESGSLIRDKLTSAGHRVCSYEILPDGPAQIRARVEALCNDRTCQAVLLTGGTGLATRDTTYEAVNAVLEKRLDGFGELFRALSYEEIGSGAMLSRAVAGVRQGAVIFSMPGSSGAVRLAMDKLILPELGHIAWLLTQ
jgi:molybdenum cofactor biosynthesis protein B